MFGDFRFRVAKLKVDERGEGLKWHASLSIGEREFWGLCVGGRGLSMNHKLRVYGVYY